MNQVNFQSGLDAYQKAQNVSHLVKVSEADETSSSSSGFAALLEGALHKTTSDLAVSEHSVAQSLVGKIDTLDVVEAVNQAEITISTVVAVRDKVVAAYQDIMKTPI